MVVQRARTSRQLGVEGEGQEEMEGGCLLLGLPPRTRPGAPSAAAPSSERGAAGLLGAAKKAPKRMKTTRHATPTPTQSLNQKRNSKKTLEGALRVVAVVYASPAGSSHCD